jgi:hypothetical protein
MGRRQHARESDSGPFHQCSSDGLLLGRLLQMIDDGVVETRSTGDETSIWQTFVRRPPEKRGRALPRPHARVRPVSQR